MKQLLRHRRRVLALMSLVLIAALLVVGSAAPQEKARAADKVKVVIFVGLGTGTAPDQIDAQERLAERFNSTHDAIEIEFMIAPHDEAGTRLVAMLSGGNAPQLVGPNGTSTIAAYFDSWADITPFIEAENFDTSDFYGPALEINSYPDKNTGLPLGLYPSFIIYNIDAFDAAGVEYPPSDYDDASWTVDELRNRAMLATLDENYNNATLDEFDPDNIIQWGYSDAWINTRGLLAMWGAENVGRPTNADYTVAVANSPEWVQGLQWYSDGIHKDHFIPGAEGISALESAGMGTPLDSGQLAMFYTHTWFLSELGEAYADLPFAIQLAPAPFNPKGQRISRIHADNFTMPEAAEHKQEAWEVMKWLTSTENIVEVCLIYGCVPARQSVADDYRAILEERFPGLDMNILFEAINYLDVPHHESWVPEYTRVEDALEYGTGLILAGEETDAKKVLDQVNAEIQGFLDEYNANR